MTITARPAPNAAPVRLKVPRVLIPLAQELAGFRRAVGQAIALDDKRGFYYFAGWHGCRWAGASITICFSCPGIGPTFTDWSSQVPGVTLPWWDWSKDAAIPATYSSEQADGEENVLAKAPIKVLNTAHKSGWPAETSR